MSAARPFELHLRDGRVWQGAEFDDGFVCVHHPGEVNICTIAVSIDGLLENRTQEDPLCGAEVHRPNGDPA